MVGKKVLIQLQPDSYSEHKNLWNMGIHDRACKIVHELESGIFLTDMFFPDCITRNDDYYHYGFLKLMHYDFIVVG